MTIEIKNIVEKIVFNEDQLLKLKDALSLLNTKKIELKEVKQIILEQRTRIMEVIIDLLGFYIDRQQSKRSYNENSESIKKFQAQIKERENLLEEIGKRLELMVNRERKDPNNKL